MTTKPTVAVLGAGAMGSAMLKTLSREGFEVVVYNRTTARAEAAVDGTNATVATTAREAVADADAVLSSLTDDEAVRDVYVGSGGGASALRAGSVVIETSTIDPATLNDIAPAIAAAGCLLVDAPVSGGAALVEAGALTVMAGGSVEAVDQAMPVLEALSARVFRMGAQGSGSTMKLAVNALIHATNIAVAEALVMVEKAGLDRSLAYEVFVASAGGSPFVEYKQEAFVNPENAAVAFRLDLMAKDLDLILGLATRVGAELTQSHANRVITGDAAAAGYGGKDMSAIASYLRGSDDPESSSR